MTAHIHAALMAEYAKDALETDKPWERWELDEGGGWKSVATHPRWIPDSEYRRKRIPLCTIEGRDVFAGDRLWHKGHSKWLIAERCSDMPDFIWCEESFHALISFLSWSKPPKTKTVYQWVGQNKYGWFASTYFYATEAEAREYFKPHVFPVIRRLDYTALEVPCDD